MSPLSRHICLAILKMRTRSMMTLTLGFLAGLVVICIVIEYNEPASIHTIVSQTHKQITNLKALKHNLMVKEERRPKFETHEKVLEFLGFSDNPMLYPLRQWTNISFPVIVSAVTANQVAHVNSFLKNIQTYLGRTVLLYPIGLGSYDRRLVEELCNTSLCSVCDLDWALFPPHVSEFANLAYRPFLIQDALVKAGAALWLPLTLRLTSNDLLIWEREAENTSHVLAWPSQHPTTALTHPKMFPYFNTEPESFFFLTMVNMDEGPLLLYNTARIHNRVMKPWLQCVLTPSCLSPLGAQNSGCEFDKRPRYRYSRCHKNDQAPLAVSLGLAFDFNESHYLLPWSSNQWFSPANLEERISSGNDTLVA